MHPVGREMLKQLAEEERPILFPNKAMCLQSELERKFPHQAFPPGEREAYCTLRRRELAQQVLDALTGQADEHRCLRNWADSLANYVASESNRQDKIFLALCQRALEVGTQPTDVVNEIVSKKTARGILLPHV